MNAHYSVLRFSPNPERVEFTNVAIVILNGRATIAFDPGFPKLSLLAPRFDARLLAEYLELIEPQLHRIDPADIPRYVATMSAQLQATSPRALLVDVTTELVNQLKHEYLERPRASHRAKKHRIETCLGDVLTSRLRIAPSAMLKSVEPDQFLREEALRDFARAADGAKVIIPRVIDSRRRLVLMDAVETANIEALRKRVGGIAFNYHLLARLRGRIAQAERRDVDLVTFVLESPRSSKESVDYTCDTLEKYGPVLRPAALNDNDTAVLRIREAAQNTQLW